jgi:hypothetical protein
MALVIDTGVLFAAHATGDPDHESCREVLEGTTEDLVVPCPVLVELEYLMRRLAPVEAWTGFCADVEAGAYSLWPVDTRLLARAAALQMKFSDLRIGFVDAAVFVTCELLEEDKVATLDRRHFGTLRTEGAAALTLIPG